jgi:hypothetical protein
MQNNNPNYLVCRVSPIRIKPDNSISLSENGFPIHTKRNENDN